MRRDVTAPSARGRAWKLGILIFAAGLFVAASGQGAGHGGSGRPGCHGHRATITPPGTGGVDGTLVGTKHRDVIVAGKGTDFVRGRGGADLVCAQAGADFVDGGSGGDRIFGGIGSDVLIGGDGKDVLVGGRAGDDLTGASQRDRCVGSGPKDDLDRAFARADRAGRDCDEIHGAVRARCQGRTPLGTCGEERAGLVFFRTASSAQYDIVLARAGGAEIRPLIGVATGSRVNPECFGRPAWSPTGRWIAITGGGCGFRHNIYLVHPNGSHLRRLTRDGESSDPVWSPNGRRIAFTRWKAPESGSIPNSSSIWEMRADGSNARRLTPRSKGVFDSPGSFSPDGSKLAFSRGRDPFSSHASSSVYLMNANGSGLHRVARFASRPSFSPSGRRIAFASYRDRNGVLSYGDRRHRANELYVMNAHGGHKRRLTRTHDLNETWPAWSPDGRRIVFQRGKAYQNGEAMSLRAINPNGGCDRLLVGDSPRGAWYSAPSWAPRARPGKLHC